MMTNLTSIAGALQFLFGGDYPPPGDTLLFHQALARAVVIYLAGLTLVRFGKSRSIGRITPLDALLGFVLGSVLGRGITGHSSLSGTIAASAGLIATHWVLTRLSCQWHWFGDLVKGHAHAVVENGQPLPDSMLHHHISTHDLEEVLRVKGVDDIQRVRLAYKERNGEVSVLTRREPPRVLEVAVQSGVQTVRIQLE